MFIHSDITQKVIFQAVRAIRKGDPISYVAYEEQVGIDGFYFTVNLADKNLVRRISDIDDVWLSERPEITFQEVKVEILYTSTVTETK
jgi:hypothetical protein